MVTSQENVPSALKETLSIRTEVRVDPWICKRQNYEKLKLGTTMIFPLTQIFFYIPFFKETRSQITIDVKRKIANDVIKATE